MNYVLWESIFCNLKKILQFLRYFFNDNCFSISDNLDWGLLELDAVRSREVVDDNHFLVMTNFGLHCLHHLLPTVDHAYLPLCQTALDETCAEFGITSDRFTWWQLVTGQFNQLRRVEPKNNSLRSQILGASNAGDSRWSRQNEPRIHLWYNFSIWRLLNMATWIF